MIFIVGIILLFFNRLNENLYSELDEYFEKSDRNQSEAHLATKSLLEIERSNIWDWVFLAIFIGLMMQMLIFSFASRTNIAFFWIFVLLGLIILIIGVVLSNVWQEFAEVSTFSETILRFPITNTLLGTYFPMAIVAILFLGMIVMFGKFPGQEGR